MICPGSTAGDTLAGLPSGPWVKGILSCAGQHPKGWTEAWEGSVGLSSGALPYTCARTEDTEHEGAWSPSPKTRRAHFFYSPIRIYLKFSNHLLQEVKSIQLINIVATIYRGLLCAKCCPKQMTCTHSFTLSTAHEGGARIIPTLQMGKRRHSKASNLPKATGK